MDKKNLIKLVMVLLVCVCIFALILLFKKLTQHKRISLDIKADKITKIEYKNQKGNYIFTKEFDKWKVSFSTFGPYPCDSQRIKELTEKLANIKLDDMVSENKERQPEFFVDASSGIFVNIYLNNENKASKNFILGKSGYDYNHYYFRYPESEKIWLSAGLERYVLEWDIEQWRDKTIVTIQKENIEKIDFKYTDKKVPSFSLLLKDTTWYLLSNGKEEKEIDKTKLDGFFNTISDLKADGFIADKGEIRKPEMLLTIKTKDENYEILLSSVVESKTSLKTSKSDTIFYIYTYKADNLKKKKIDF